MSGWNGLDVDGYLRRLGLDRERPSVAALHRLQRAHVERVPYENLEIQLGRPTTVDPAESAARIIAGRGGYCFHLNGALSGLLSALGYDVVRHVGGVQGRDEAEPVGATGNHLALTVRGLPDPAAPDGVWFVDAGLGDALHDPLPLVAGEYRQGPLRFGLRPSTVVPGGWRFDHDPRYGSFAGMDFAPEPAGPEDFADKHSWLSTAPESGFVRVFTVQRRDEAGYHVLRGCVYSRIDQNGRVDRELLDRADWYQVLQNVLELRMSTTDLDRLWPRLLAAHEQWRRAEAAGREKELSDES